MELFPGSTKKSWDIIRRVIDESDYFFLIIAGRYGSTKKRGKGKYIGYTEMEYNYAKRTKKPIIAFLHKNVGNIASKNVEPTEDGKERLNKFRRKVLNSNINVSFWKDMGTLVSEIKSSIQDFAHDNTEMLGWVKVSDIDANIFNEDYKQKVDIVESWGLEKVFKTRAEKNAESDPKLEKHNLKQLDGVAFGLSSFRCTREKDVLKNLCNGMNMRLITMDPATDFVKQREVEEKAQSGSISGSINALVDWVNRLNAKSTNGKIEIKYYNAMTLDFYWRMDDELYIGPYLYGIVSQQTITYKFVRGGRGFNIYTDYFESLWNNVELCKYPEKFIQG